MRLKCSRRCADQYNMNLKSRTRPHSALPAAPADGTVPCGPGKTRRNATRRERARGRGGSTHNPEVTPVDEVPARGRGIVPLPGTPSGHSENGKPEGNPGTQSHEAIADAGRPRSPGRRIHGEDMQHQQHSDSRPCLHLWQQVLTSRAVATTIVTAAALVLHWSGGGPFAIICPMGAVGWIWHRAPAGRAGLGSSDPRAIPCFGTDRRSISEPDGKDSRRRLN
jgi:hypothetical protein